MIYFHHFIFIIDREVIVKIKRLAMVSFTLPTRDGIKAIGLMVDKMEWLCFYLLMD